MACLQVQYERHAAQAAVAQTAKVQLRKETEWMRRQPKARSTKSKSRQDAFYTLSDTARSGPKQEAKADFGQGAMARQVRKPEAETHSFVGYLSGAQIGPTDLDYCNTCVYALFLLSFWHCFG